MIRTFSTIEGLVSRDELAQEETYLFENTTDVVFIHKMNSDMEKQIIGRAQRPGRKGVLEIHRLKHPNEQ